MSDREEEIRRNLEEARQDGVLPEEWATCYANDVSFLLTSKDSNGRDAAWMNRARAAESKLAAAEAAAETWRQHFLGAQNDLQVTGDLLAAADAAIEAALGLHERKMKIHRAKGPNEWWCGHCHNDWPCPTVKALAAYDWAPRSTTPEEPE